MFFKIIGFLGVLVVTVGLFPFQSSPWAAEKYPARPIELIIPFGAGGMHDLQSRILASVAYNYLGQALVVTMKPGAGGVVGTAYVSRAKRDGYTLLLGSTGPNSITCQIENTGFTQDDFIPIAQISQAPSIVVVGAGKPWKTLGELIEYIRKDPPKAIFGTAGAYGVTGLGNMMLLQAAGIKSAPATIPFKAAGEMILATIKGDNDYHILISVPNLPFISTKEVRALAVLDDKRDPFLPDVPTTKELGYNVVSKQWLTIFVAKGTSPEIIEVLSKAFANMVKDESFLAMMRKSEITPGYKDRGEFKKYWDDEYKAYGELIKQLGLRKK
jgi:tripartite-type tricarboxylate transporter receptor subunit TctC